MTDWMAVYPFSQLLRRIFAEYAATGEICGIPESSWYRCAPDRRVEVFGQELATPLGPAAGPHTQLAVNIVASYLTGSRFIELKTTQILESLEIAKPCIDAADEGYNTEWSTELSLETAWQEYAKAWILVNILENVFGFASGERSFVFNLSVGYDLKGIQSPPMQQYIRRMIDSSAEELFSRWLAEAKRDLPELLRTAGMHIPDSDVQDLVSSISPGICTSVTLSTMHGCPPAEIEAIASYMIRDIGLDCYVKLNPTLLGYDDACGILEDTGFGFIRLDPEGFGHDLQWSDALPMLTRLRDLAAANRRRFGVKLSNTLANVNDGERLPGEERYLSGRALFPVTIELAARIAEAFRGELPISYSGGISAWNVRQVFETGIRPVTLATDMLKPGGYLRQLELMRILDGEARASSWTAPSPDPRAIRALADEARHSREYRKAWRSPDQVRNPGPLPLTDCYVAPCVTACPIGQKVPEYIRLAGEGRTEEAMRVILEDNALPGITGAICDHACELHCTRLDYEGCVNIREVKHIAAQGAPDTEVPMRSSIGGPRTAIIGAGPAGLSAAYFLARAGVAVEIFERANTAGGVVRNIVPHFRIPKQIILRDIRRIEDLGVTLHLGWAGPIDFSAFRADGFERIILALGTWKDRPLQLGEHMPVIGAYEFLERFNRGERIPGARGRAVIIGAGDTAMDCARAALRMPDVSSSTVLYRRAFDQMPASREEYELAREDGVEFLWLRSPETSPEPGVLETAQMQLGETDGSGRRRPVPTGASSRIAADFCVAAVGDDPDFELFASLGLLGSGKQPRVETDANGASSIDGVYVIGDSRTGGTSIVNCIAEGRRAADAILGLGESDGRRSSRPGDGQAAQIAAKRGRAVPKGQPRNAYDPAAFAAVELERCLECNYVCNKCVDVCPNRANIAVAIPGEEFANAAQIVHLDGLCNECGNCGQFCPWDGRPYIDKPTVFSSREAFDESANPGWFVDLSGPRARGWRRFAGRVEAFDPAGPATGPGGDPGGIGRSEFDALFAELFAHRRELFAYGDRLGEVRA
jgi:putative selenate reductase